MTAPDTVADYLGALSPDAATRVGAVVDCIRRTAPDTAESISYAMPTFRFANGRPIFVAAWKHHLSLHAVPRLSAELEAEVGPYRSGADTLTFPNRQRLPIELIARIVEAVSAAPTAD
jgi:uncharacterized protein YdhG (YjbR/CyaY superfamily)